MTLANTVRQKLSEWRPEEGRQELTVSAKDGSPYHGCGGNMFGGVMKPAEKATIQFSCMKKENIPDGVSSIEGEMQVVGFTDASGQKVTYYWRNNDLAPDARKKGGVK